MKFKNKVNNEVVEVTDSILLWAYTHNSNWEEVEEKAGANPEGNSLESLTKAQLVEKLAELGIEANDKQKKDELIALVKEAEEKAGANPEGEKSEEE